MKRIVFVFWRLVACFGYNVRGLLWEANIKIRADGEWAVNPCSRKEKFRRIVSSCSARLDPDPHDSSAVLYRPRQFDVALLSVVGESYLVNLVYNGTRWVPLVPPPVVDNFCVDPGREWYILFRGGLRLKIEEHGPGITLKQLLLFLGGGIGTDILLFSYQLGMEAERTKRQQELLGPALERIRASKRFCKRVELKEAGELLEQAIGV